MTKKKRKKQNDTSFIKKKKKSIVSFQVQTEIRKHWEENFFKR